MHFSRGMIGTPSLLHPASREVNPDMSIVNCTTDDDHEGDGSHGDDGGDGDAMSNFKFSFLRSTPLPTKKKFVCSLFQNEQPRFHDHNSGMHIMHYIYLDIHVTS